MAMSKSGERYKSMKEMRRHEASESMAERKMEYGPSGKRGGKQSGVAGKWCRKNCK